MPEHKYEVRTMTRAEVDLAVDWAALEGWNPGLHDADCFYETDPNGFFIGMLNDEPIGCVSAVSYGESYGFIGFYIVKPDYRKQGFGIPLWNKAMEHLSGRNIGLDGVVAQQDNYKKSGFQLAHRNIRYEWRSTRNQREAQGITELSGVPSEDLLMYDAKLFGNRRDLFLKCWISRPGTIALGVVQGARLEGYGVLRRCRQGFKIGPLFADSADVAEILFLALTADLPVDTPTFLDVPEVNPQAIRMAQKYGMSKVFETARMYTEHAPHVPLHQWFGVTTFELG
jgi:ribosomal protein S18 acetylase RimI-like enzyme